MNKFCDLFIGIGADYNLLIKVRDVLRELMPNSVEVVKVDNITHNQYGKFMIEIKNWWACD